MVKCRLTIQHWKHHVVLFSLIRHLCTVEQQLGSSGFFLSLPASNFISTLQKTKRVILVCICIDFGSRSSDCCFFLFFNHFLDLFLFLISSLDILSHLFSISNLVPINLIAIFFYHFFYFCLFSTLPFSILSHLNICIQFGSYFFNCYFLFFYFFIYFSI